MTDTNNTTDKHWHAETDADGVAWLCIDKADGGANVLSGPVLEELASMLEPMLKSPPKAVVIHSGKNNGFVMGADINEFTKIKNPDEAYDLIRLGQQVLDRVADLRCPTAAVINGYALGGGLELAMACDYRIAIDSDKPILGLPEVQLGIHPGFGGTVRAVQICGVRQAMQLMLTGKSIRVSKGRRIGLVDTIVPEDGWRQAARDIVTSGRKTASAPLLDRLLNLALIRPVLAGILRKQVAPRARREHYPAPYAIIDLWQRHGASPATAYEAEARSIAELMCTPTSRNLVRVFFLQNKLKSQGGRSGDKVGKVHVVGAGVMGGDIAAWCALRGLHVTLQDREEKYITPAIERAEKLFAKKIPDEGKRKATGDRLTADVNGKGAADADLLIEAIFEDMDAKKTLYETLEKSMKPGAILATNTSSLRLEDLRTNLKEPTRFIGLHFFNPVAKLPLIEVVHCEDTDQAVMDTAFGFVKAIGKTPLACKSAPGFVVNRLLAPYMAEAMYLSKDGVALADIDRAAEDFGMPMGPVELVDSVGIDVALNVSRVLGEAFDRPVPDKLEEMVDAKQLGRKSGQGFYRWEDGKVQKPDSDGASVPDDIEDRLMLPMVNEAVACLTEEIVASPDLLDAGVIFGTGFAPFRGGPLKYARDRGIDEVVQRLEDLAARHGERFKPHPGWSDLEARFAGSDG